MVRKNLYDFLITARLIGKLLWIKATCIDQTSTLEKNHQVRLMSNIYSAANNVLVWLRQGDANVAYTLQLAADKHAANDAVAEGVWQMSSMAPLPADRSQRPTDGSLVQVYMLSY